jgi:membrane fusion protein
MVRVYPGSEGRLARLLVSDGDIVTKDQALAVIDGGRTLADGQHLEALLLDEYRIQQTALERQLARQERLRDKHLQALESRLASAGRELVALDARIEIVEERARLLERRRQRHEALAASGHITLKELDDLREAALDLAGERRALAAQRVRRQADRAAVKGELDRLPEELDNAMDGLRLRLSELSQEVARLRGSRAYVVQAPLSGRVSNISLQPGQKTRYASPLMSLIPAGAPLVARLLVPVRAAGFIEPGQPLAIRYDAFPYQRYGLQAGRIVKVADSATLPGDNALLPLSLEEPAFRVTALPDRSTIEMQGGRIALKSGMTFSADVVLEKRSLLQWLLDPLHGLRERLR